jgi:hypothetical protein
LVYRRRFSTPQKWRGCIVAVVVVVGDAKIWMASSLLGRSLLCVGNGNCAITGGVQRGEHEPAIVFVRYVKRDKL